MCGLCEGAFATAMGWYSRANRFSFLWPRVHITFVLCDLGRDRKAQRGIRGYTASCGDL